jgi:ribosomal protein L40E
MAEKRRPKISNKIPKLVGKYKQARVSLVGASFLFESELNEALGLFILDEIFRRQSILSKVKGIIRKAHHCRKCDADLMGLKARGRRFSLDLSYKDLPTFRLEIEMPAIPCRKCGTNNAVNEENTELIVSAALAKAFQERTKQR